MFIGWTYTRFLFLALIGNPTWLPGPIMCSSHGGHLEFPIGKRFASLVQDHPMIIPAKSQFNHNNCSITLYITVNKKTVIFRSKTVYTGPLSQSYASFLHILLSIIIAIRNVCRIIILKDLNWKMCKKDAYDCDKGPVYTVFDLKITVFLLTVSF
jgi:hypothetical protein